MPRPNMFVLFLATTLQLALSVHCQLPLNPESKGCRVPKGFSKLLFHDGFGDRPAGSLPSPNRWTLDLGTSYPGGPPQWGNQEVQTYTSQRANIHITARKTLLITPVRASNGSWTSARIETNPEWDFGCAPGQRLRVEFKTKLSGKPKAERGNNNNSSSSSSTRAELSGIWPAGWLLGSKFRGNFQNWPGIGEIDIMESLNGEPRNFHVAHCGINPGGPCNEPSGVSNISESVRRGVWHTYSWEVDRRAGGNGSESMTWAIDGVPKWTLRQSDLGDAGAWQVLAADKKMVLFNVAVGGAFADAIAGFKTPTNETVGGRGAAMEVDYVAVYAS
ncbi:glucan endo-1,3-beta-glucosidase A1-like protein, partial [Metarhizium majus ARSEF 297]